MTGAFASANHLVLGKLKTDEQSNEIPALPRRLALLDIKSTMATIYAIGCQKEIAQQIMRQKGHYVLAAKSNHQTLHAKVKSLLDGVILQDPRGMQPDHCSSVDGDH